MVHQCQHSKVHDERVRWIPIERKVWLIGADDCGDMMNDASITRLAQIFVSDRASE